MADFDLENGVGTTVRQEGGPSEVHVDLDLNSLVALVGLADVDLFVVDDGAGDTIRKIVASDVYAYILAKLDARTDQPISTIDLDAAADIGADLVDVDLIMVDDGAAGTNRKSAMSRVWDYVKTKLQASIDIAITILDIDGATPIGAPLVDVDLIIVDDGAGGTNRSSAMSLVWDYIKTKLQAATDIVVTILDIPNATDIGADIAADDKFVIHDQSAGANRRADASRFKQYANKLESSTYNSSQLLTDAECFGYTIYVTGAGTISLPAIQPGMIVAIIVIGNILVHIDPNGADKIWLDGVELDDGDKITSKTLTGDGVVLTYFSGLGWVAQTNGWTDGGA